MTKQDRLLQMKNIIAPILSTYQVKRADFFGSIVRDDFGHNSDVDIVIEPTYGQSGFFITRLKRDIEAQLNTTVDVITYNSIHPSIRPYIEKDRYRIL